MPIQKRTCDTGGVCTEKRFGRARSRLRKSLSRFQLHQGFRGGSTAPEPKPVTGATPGFDACHGIEEGWDVHAHPTLAGELLRSSSPLWEGQP